MEFKRGKCTICEARLAGVSRWEGNYRGIEYRLCWPCVDGGGHQTMLRWIEENEKEKAHGGSKTRN